MEKDLILSVKNAVQALYGAEIGDAQVTLQKTKKEFVGDWTLVCFPLLKISRKNPAVTAEEIGAYLKENDSTISDYNVINGFLNLSINANSWVDLLENISKDENFGFKPVTENSPLVMIEYSSPNTNKPLHLGHIRNNLLGFSLSEIMKANGYKVVKTNIVNDRGIHICKSMLAWQKFGNGATPESIGKKGDHLVGDYYVAFDKAYKAEIKELMAGGMDEEEAKKEAPLMKEAQEMLRKWEAGDAEVRTLWKTMNDWVYAGFVEIYT